MKKFCTNEEVLDNFKMKYTGLKHCTAKGFSAYFHQMKSKIQKDEEKGLSFEEAKEKLLKMAPFCHD